MKILQLGKFYPIRGGVEKVMYDIMRGLSRRRIQCDMLCASTEDYPAGDIRINAYANVFVMPTALKVAATMLAPSMLWRLRRIANDYDIIHVHHPDPMAALALFLSGYKGKVLLHWHSDIVKQKNLMKLYKPLQDWLIKRADYIVGTTPIYVQQSPFLQDYQSKMDYIPIGIDPLTCPEEKIRTIREKYKDKFLIYSIGRLVEYKGYEYLIKAAVHLPVNYKVIIAGKGPLHEALKDLIVRLKVEDKVELLGFLSDEEAHAYFHACDLYVLSSVMKTEAFAIVQIEAMSCGKPVVTAEIPGSGVSWVNQDGVSGLLCKREDPKDLAKKITQIGEDESLRMVLGKGAKTRFDTVFTMDAMIDKTLNIYNTILENYL